MFTRSSRFEVVASKLGNASGTLVDVGARNRILKKYLPATIEYKSADFDPGHDYRWDLEKPIDLPDDSFDYAASLDVLEHVENIHQALKELIRITRKKLYISLPNMSFLGFRLHFLRHGMVSGKYSLLENHQGDRHRWLTQYSQMGDFMKKVAQDECGCKVAHTDVLDGFTFTEKIASRLPLSPALRAYLVVYEITKKP